MQRKLVITFLFSLTAASLFGQVRKSEAKKESELYQLIHGSEVFSDIFTGFALYGPEEKNMIFEKDADKYYTPASNTKILTFYTVLKVLGDSMPALRYVEMGDSLIFWGTGNPMFLHPALPQDTTVLAFLRDTSRQLFFSTHNFKDKRFGPGWAWDDYNYNYQAEKSSFPIYGNMAYFVRDELSEGFTAYPEYFQQKLAFNPSLENPQPKILREEHRNIFEYNNRALTGIPFEQEVPFNTSPSVIAELLSDTLKRPLRLANLEELPARDAKTISVAIPDTLYRRLMKDSDNFIAEQLLLACSEKIIGAESTEDAIRYAIDSLYATLPDKLVWRDGSGLSRYNLLTPRSLVGVLELLYRELPRERLFDIFPAGGVSGTIEELYAGANGEPYVYAKTGTLSNKHCLSGYLLAQSGKVYIFSFMNNNYLGGPGPVKSEMEKVLRYVRDNY